MREVLIIAYYFPPLGGSGVVRPVKFAKYLLEFGWRPTILTVEQGDSFFIDDTLLQELPNQVCIERARSLEIIRTTRAKRLSDQLIQDSSDKSLNKVMRKKISEFLKACYFSVFIPDDKIGWIRPAVRKGLQIGQQHDFDVIFATAPPQSNLIVAMRLQRYFQIPLVVDYRDEWTTNPHKAMPNQITLWINRFLEKRVMKKADALTVVSRGMLDNLCQAQIVTNGKVKSEIIPNGFDPADFKKQINILDASPKFHIVYTGSFYGEYRVPDPFLYGLHRWLNNFPKVRDDIEVSFCGSIYPRHQQLMDQLGLSEFIHFTGVVSHQEAVDKQLTASILLLIIGNGEGKAVLTGKMFEYFGAQKPILAIVPPSGEAAELITKTNTGIVIDPEDIQAIANALQDYYERWRVNQLNYEPNQAQVNLYSRREQARQLGRLFEQIGQSS